MTRPAREELDITNLLSQLAAVGEDAPPFEQKLEIARSLRGQTRDSARQLDQFLIEQVERLRLGLDEARDSQQKLQAVLREMTEPPLHPAVFLGLVPAGGRDGAMVLYGSARRLVTISDEIDPLSLEVGDEVLLGSELNVVIERSPDSFFRTGETAGFDRYTPDGRLVLRYRDEEIVVDPASSVRDIEFETGDLVRWDRTSWMAFEKVARSKGTDLFLEEKPQESFDSIGGLDRQIESLQRSIRLHLYHREVVKKYHLRQKGSVLLVGPPGTGKTMMARALANWLGTISGSGRSRFMSIKPAGLHSMWYGQTEANYREAFRVAREAGAAEPDVPVVMFFDEIDSLGGSRGHSHQRIDDRVLTSFMTELDGLDRRGNILVVGATNRRDAIDPALLRPGRLGDLVLEVPRPGMNAAREIFARHLPGDIPYAAAREELISAAVSRMYAPNGGNELATITFRDGKRRTVKAADLISGASIAKIAQTAIEQACVSEIERDDPGVKIEQLLSAIAEEFETLSANLTPANCGDHLSDLPQDVDVVRVEPLQRKVARPHRYLNVA